MSVGHGRRLIQDSLLLDLKSTNECCQDVEHQHDEQRINDGSSENKLQHTGERVVGWW